MILISVLYQNASTSRTLEPSPQGLISSVQLFYLGLATRIKRCYQKDTLRALEMGAAETLVCWENLDVQRITLKNHASGEEKILHLTSEQEKDKTHFTDAGKSIHNFH